MAPPTAAQLEQPTRLPTPVNVTVADRRARMLSTAEGRVLDLAVVENRERVRQALARSAAPMPEEEPEQFDVAISTANLVLFPDAVATLTGIGRLLRPGGELWLVEPVHHPGMVSTAFATLWSWHPSVRTVHVERDIPAALRAAGFTITDLERFVVRTSCWPLRQFVQAVAVPHLGGER